VLADTTERFEQAADVDLAAADVTRNEREDGDGDHAAIVVPYRSRVARSLVRRVVSTLPDPVRERIAPAWRRARGRLGRGYDALGEIAVTRSLLEQLGVRGGTAVDVAACDGVTKSNTLALYENGWRGLAVEGDPRRFAQLARVYSRLPQVGLARLWVTPANIVGLLESAGVGEDFEFLSLDLDSYDHYVLAAILERFQPQLVCAEINEKIPPPLRFTVTFDPDHVWQGDHFYGQSISKLHELAVRHDYVLVRLHYNNAFLAPAASGLPASTPEEAYRAGYLDRPDRLRAFPWNADMEALHSLPLDEQLAFVRRRFAAYEGRFELEA